MNAIDFYIETWKNKMKPFTHNSYYAQKKNIPISSEAYRYTTEQPLIYISEIGEKSFNKRKLKELPHLLAQLEHDKAVIFSCEHFIFNYDFIYAKLLTTDVNIIIEEMKKLDDGETKNEQVRKLEKQISIFSVMIITDMFLLQKNPQMFPIQLCARGLIFYRILNCFKKLIDGADLKSPMDCALVTPYGYLQPPGNGNLITIDSHSLPIQTTILDERFFITCSNKLHLFEIQELKIFGEIIQLMNSINIQEFILTKNQIKQIFL